MTDTFQKDTFMIGSGTWTPCSSGHTVIWAGSLNYEIAEGTPCACGRTKVHYTTCPTCGHKRMEMIPTNNLI